MPKTVTRMSSMESAFARLESLRAGSRALHFAVAKECSFLLKNKEYLKEPRKNNQRLDDILEDVLPGLTKTTLEKMHDAYPKQSDWNRLGFSAIRDEVLSAQIKKTRDRASGRELPAKPSLTGKGQIDTTGRLNEGGGVGGLKVSELQEMRDQIASLSQENAELRQSRDEAYRRIGELEMELKKMRG